MTRGSYFPRLAREQVSVDWNNDAAWDNFDLVEVTMLPANRNTITLTGSQGIGTATGSVSGDGNDRRFYMLKNFLARNVELEASFDVGPDASPGQIGLVVRHEGNLAVVEWCNIVFGITGQLLHGVWEYDQIAGTVATNQGTTLDGFKADTVSSSGNGTTFTVKTRTPHGLIVGSLVDLTGINAGLPNAGAVTVVTDALTFGVASAVTGPFTGGTYKTYAWKARAKAKVRLIDNVVQSKQWFRTEGEPPWGDPNRTITNTLPATLSSGHAPPNSKGRVGLTIGHLGSTKFVTVSDFCATNLDN